MIYIMEDHDYDTAWDWGESSQEFVEKFLENARDGTFLVFHSGSTGNMTLAVRVNGENKLVSVYHQDGLFGFSEPLNFDSLEDALDAYNWSPTDTGDTLKYPGIKPDSPLHRTMSRSSRASLYEAEPLTLLRKLRNAVSDLRTMSVGYDSAQDENKQLEERLQELSNSLDSVTCLIRILEAQVSKHNEVYSRSTISSKETSDAFSANYEKLISRLSELSEEKHQLAEQKSAVEQEKSKAERHLAISHAEIQQVVNERIAIKGVLLRKNPNFEVFLESLMNEDLSDYPLVEILNIDKSAAEKMLKSFADGTFLVRNSKKDPQKPYVISITYMSKFHHFPVLQIEECVGLDENTCIFENVHELVKHYSRVPFSVHDEKYGTLTLTQQLNNLRT